MPWWWGSGLGALGCAAYLCAAGRRALVLEADLLAALRRGDVLGDPAALPPLRDDWDVWRESH